MRRFAIVSVMAVSMLPAIPAHAWNDQGHEIVALIAEHYLSPPAREKMAAMLAADTDPLTAHDIAHEAIWADKYQKQAKDPSKPGVNDTSAWHFADIDAARPNIPAACFGHPELAVGTVASSGPAQACIIDKIAQFSDELANPKTSAAERLLALKFLLNLVGDIHQPLRVADEANGHGMMIHVSAKSITPGDLFNYWDDAFVYMLGVDAKAVSQQLISRISDQEVGLWNSGTPQLWALEAHQLGVDRAYGMLGEADAGGAIPLKDADIDRAAQTIAVQMSRAGVRLAYIIDQALAPAPAHSAAPALSQGDAKAGRAFAMEKCTACHVIAPDQSSPQQFTNAPDFASIANTRGVSPVALHEFLFGPHPTMPNLMLSPAQADDVAAFILSMRRGH